MLPSLTEVNHNREESMNQSELKEYLTISDKGKLSWAGDFELLKIFLKEILNIRGQWSSPGGEAKAVENDKLIIRWYASKQSLTISGASSKAIKAKLVKLVNKAPDNIANSTLVSSEKDKANGNQKPIEATIPVLRHKFLGIDNERENNSGEQTMEGETSYCERDQPRGSENIYKTDSDHPP